MFYLKSGQNKAGEKLIYLQFNFSRNKYLRSVGISIHPDQWDAKRHRPKRSFRFYPEYNSLLNKLEAATWAAYYHLISFCNPSKAQLAAEIDARMIDPVQLTVAAYAAQFVQNREESGSYKVQSIRLYRTTAAIIAEYDPAAGFDQIDIEWLEGFRTFLLRKKTYGQNTAQKHFRTLKTILNDATAKGLNTSMKYRTGSVSIARKETTKVFLDEREVMAVYYAEMPNPEKDQARDVFVLSCLTGIRFSDIGAINRTSLRVSDGVHYFTFRDFKTGYAPEIPAHPLVLKILDKYDWTLPRVSSQKYNAHLKEICQIAKIDQIVTITTYPGGIRKDTDLPKYTQITSHTARRSLICNLYISGVPVETIKKISGHRSHEAFMAYMRLTPKDHLQVAFKSDFYREQAKR